MHIIRSGTSHAPRMPCLAETDRAMCHDASRRQFWKVRDAGRSAWSLFSMVSARS